MCVQMVAQEHRLGSLEVRVARKTRVGRRSPRSHERVDQFDARRARRSLQRVAREETNVVATWSFRLRAVWSLAPTSPASSVTRRSMAMWMSSSLAARTNSPRSNSPRIWSSVDSSVVASLSLKSPAAASPRTWALDPHDVVGVEDVVKRVALREIPERLVHGRTEPTAPERHDGGVAFFAPWRCAQVFTPSP